jgi:prepilin-type N-terminal cleavage/methylation domain-containing protein
LLIETARLCFNYGLGLLLKIMNNTVLTAPFLVQPQRRHKVDLAFSSRQQSDANLNAGFTLIEALVVIAVAAILMSIALPNISNFIANGRISSATNDLVSDLMLARSMASSNRGQAVVCASNATSCSPAVTCSTTQSDWIFLGRIVFIDKHSLGNADGSCNPSDIIIKHTAPTLTPDTSSTLTPTSFAPVSFTNNPNNWVAFNSYGGMTPVGSGSFKLCVHGASLCRQISIDYSGRASVTKVP